MSVLQTNPLASHTHLLKKLGVDVDAGVNGGRKRLDGPSRVQGVDPDIQQVQLLCGEHLVPRGAKLEQALPRVFVHLQQRTGLGPRKQARAGEKHHSSCSTSLCRKKLPNPPPDISSTRLHTGGHAQQATDRHTGGR